MKSNAIQVFKALSDRSRLGIINALLDDEPKYVELLSEQLHLAASTVSFHLKKLEDAGLVRRRKRQYYAEYQLNTELLEISLRSMVEVEDWDRHVQEERVRLYRRKVLDTFFQDGRLLSIPVQRKKRQIVLEHLAEEFESGRTYSELEVNGILKEYHPDTATLRRELVMERLLERKPNQYWKPSEGETLL